jgi:putative membrane protein
MYVALRGTVLSLAALLVLGTSPAWAGGDKAKMGNLDKESFEVLKKVHLANAVEIQAGRLAMEKGSTEKVREYGDHLVKDHTIAEEKLTAFAKKNNVDLASQELIEKKQDKLGDLDDLRKASGREFDKKFIGMMEKDHRKVLDVVKEAREDVKNPDLVALLGELEPKLEHHKQMAETLKAGTPDRQGRRPMDSAPDYRPTDKEIGRQPMEQP